MNGSIVRVVILSHHSLLAGGVASRLREYSATINVRVIDWELPALADTLLQEAPDFIILDAGDEDICRKLPIVNLLEWLPRTRVIRLSLKDDSAQVFVALERKIEYASDLVNLLQSFSGAELP